MVSLPFAVPSVAGLCGGQRLLSGVGSSPFTLWVPGMELWLSGLVASAFTGCIGQILDSE